MANDPEIDPGTWWSLEGRTAVVIGGSGWLGLPIVAALARVGADVVIVGRDQDRLDSALADLGVTNGYCTAVRCDVSQSDDISELVGIVGAARSPASVLVNCFQAPYPPETDVKTDPEFPAVVTRDLVAHWRIISALLETLRDARKQVGDAAIINIASMYGKVSPQPPVYAASGVRPNPLFYGVTKAGLLQMSRWLAVFLASDAIRVNTVSPGPFPQAEVQLESPHFVDLLASRAPVGRIGHRREIGPAVAFLASPGASYITGSDLAVDGGWTAW